MGIKNRLELFHLIMNHAHIWEYLIGPDGKLKYASASSKRYTGYSAETFMNDENLFLNIIHPDDKDQILNRLFHEVRGCSFHAMEYRVVDAAKQIRWFSMSCQPLCDNSDNFLGKRVSNYEITRYKKEISQNTEAAGELQETTTLLYAVLDAIPDVIGVQDIHHNIIRYNQAGYDYLGKLPDEVRNKKCYSLIGLDKPCDICATSQVYKTKKAAQCQKYVQELDAWMDVRAYPVLDENGNLVKVVEHLRDITKEKKSEAQLQLAHERLITILDSIEAHVHVVDMETGKILFMNDKMKKDFHVDDMNAFCLDSFLGGQKTCEDKIKEEWVDANGQPGGIITQEWFSPITRRWYMNHGRAIQWVDGRMVKMQISTDISVAKNNEALRNKMENQLQQAQKFEAVGTLAGGIAHNFNNLLTGILGQASLMFLGIAQNHPLRKRIDDIMVYVQKATELTDQLLGLAKGGKYEILPVDVNQVLSESALLFERTKKEVKIYRKLAEPAPVIEADQRQIEQVFLNLFINAWQAMPHGGDIYLETRIETFDAHKKHLDQQATGRFVKISVSDTGVGIEKKILGKIFDPFFTTKEKSRGTGLGLASAYGIITNHNGYINVRSTVGKGSTFDIYLPASQKIVPAKMKQQEAVVTGKETILLVDDEQMVREVGEEMLGMLGYQVKTAGSGEGAVALIKEGSVPVDLIILDMVMPGMDGAKTYEIIKKIAPSIPVILASGYSLDGKANQMMDNGCNAFIQKPFSMELLSATVRKVLRCEYEP